MSNGAILDDLGARFKVKPGDVLPIGVILNDYEWSWVTCKILVHKSAVNRDAAYTHKLSALLVMVLLIIIIIVYFAEAATY